MHALRGLWPGFGEWEWVERVALRAVWVVFAGIYLCLAFQAYGSLDVKLARAGFRIPASRQTHLGNLPWHELINQLAENQDKTAAILEQSIRSSARTALMLNLTGVCVSLLCLMAHCRPWGTRVRVSVRKPGKPAMGAAALNSRDWPCEDGTETAMALPHDGCFPDGGYGR